MSLYAARWVGEERPSGAIPATPSKDDAALDARGAPMVTQSIETSQQFFQWFRAIEDQMEQEQESSFRQYDELLTKYSQLCADVLTEIEHAKSFLGVSCACSCCMLPYTCVVSWSRGHECSVADCVALHGDV